MENRIYNEQNGLWYELQGNYYIPCLTLPTEENQPIGVWGQRHARYLKEHRKVLYMNLLTSGKLNSHLADIEKQAEEIFYRLVNETAKAQGITEQLKASEPMLWVGKMNAIRNAAMEVVNSEMIFI